MILMLSQNKHFLSLCAANSRATCLIRGDKIMTRKNKGNMSGDKEVVLML